MVFSVGAKLCGLFNFFRLYVVLKGKPFKLKGKRLPVLVDAQNLM